MALYIYQRKFWLTHMKQLRMMIRDRRQVSEARDCLKRAQRSCARLRQGLAA